MALHQALGKDSEETASLDTYAHGLSAGTASESPHAERQCAVRQWPYNLIRDELLLDGNSRQNLATFCTTWVSPEVRQLISECVDKNMIDKDEYPQTAEIESRAVHILANLWHSPAAATTIGCSTTGSSEAAMLGGLAMKWSWRKKKAMRWATPWGPAGYPSASGPWAGWS